MSAALGQPPPGSPRDLVDHIAKGLPAEARAEYYRIMRYCRSLPESDELLCILNAMQLLTLLIHDAPSRVAAEREALDRSFTRCASALAGIEKRLDELPRSLASSIGPEQIAEGINESLRQQFHTTTIPQSSAALMVCAQELKQSVEKFSAAAVDIVGKHRGAARASSEAVGAIENAIRSAASATRNAIADLTSLTTWLTWINVCAGAAVFFVLGFIVAMYWLPR